MCSLQTNKRKSSRIGRHLVRLWVVERLETRRLLAPLADDGATTLEDATVNINVAANDAEIWAGSTVQVLAPPSHGSAVPGPGTTFNYTPTANYSGSDLFTYGVIAKNLPSTSATVQVKVSPVADAIPLTAHDTTGPANTDLPLRIDVGKSPDTDGSETPPTTVKVSLVPANISFCAAQISAAAIGTYRLHHSAVSRLGPADWVTSP